MAPVRQPRRVWQARFINLLNVPMRVLLSLPLTSPLSSQLMLLYLTGRRTGRTFRQPVSFVRDGDTLLTPGGGRWTLNLREGACVRLRLGGRARLARPEIIKGSEDVERLLRLMIGVNPRLTRFAPVAGPDGRLDQRRVEDAVRHGFCLVRWHFDCPGG